MRTASRLFFFAVTFAICFAAWAQNPPSPALQEQARKFTAELEQAPKLKRDTLSFPIQPPVAGWAVDIVSSVAVDGKGVIYALQRGDKADPIIAFDQSGKVIRSWGKGLYNIPHTIRIDSAGNFWT